jgi:4-hydroxyproline epimerase
LPGLIFDCIDGHTCGNPVRLVKTGIPKLKSTSISEKREEFVKKYDWIRTGLMYEPRGHDMMSGSFIFPPENPQNDFAILFIETSGCLPMCGHGTIGTVTFALEEGLIKPKTAGELKIEVPAGLITVGYKEEGKRISEVSIKNVPSFLFKEGLEIKTKSLGNIKLDIAYGGNFYGIIEPQGQYRGLDGQETFQLIQNSREIRDLINKNLDVVHPVDDRIRNVTHILWAEKPETKDSPYRNAVFYGDKAIDRSPCGTGTSARMAQLFARKELKIGATFIHESIIGSRFSGRILKEIRVGGMEAIIPEISGSAVITGYNKLILDESKDPFWKGFRVK